jgi:hypothetical protein
MPAATAPRSGFQREGRKMWSPSQRWRAVPRICLFLGILRIQDQSLDFRRCIVAMLALTLPQPHQLFSTVFAPTQSRLASPSQYGNPPLQHPEHPAAPCYLTGGSQLGLPWAAAAFLSVSIIVEGISPTPMVSTPLIP